MYSDKALRQARKYQDLFIVAFKEILTKGLVHEYAVYEPAFLEITKFVWENRNVTSSPYQIERFQDNIQNLISACIASDSINSKKLGLKLIAALYKELGKCVISNGIRENHCDAARKKLNIFSTDDFFKLVGKLDCDALQDTIIIPELLYNMNLAEMALYYDVSPDTFPWRPSEVVADIQAYLGSYIAQQRQDGNKPSVNYWAREFTMWLRADRQPGIEQALKPFFVSAAGTCGALYSCGLISRGCFDILELGLHKAGLYTPIIVGETGKRALVSVYAFIYYMYVRENKNYVGEELAESLRLFWPRIAKIFSTFISCAKGITELLVTNLNTEYHTCNINENKSCYVDIDGRWIYYVLKRFDFRVRNTNDCSNFIMEEAIRDFSVYTILNMPDYLFTKQLAWMADQNHSILDFIPYVLKDRRDEINKQILDFINFEKKEENAKEIEQGKKNEKQAEFIYRELFRNITTLYKEGKTSEANEKEIHFLQRKNVIDNEKSNWKRNIISTINDVFKTNIIANTNPHARYREVQLFQCTAGTNEIESFLDGSQTYLVVAMLLDAYIKQLIEAGFLKQKRRVEFADDMRYIKFLKAEQVNMFMGSEYLLKNWDWEMTEVFKNETCNFGQITSNACMYGMAYKREAVRFFLSDLDVTVRACSLEDESVKYDGGTVEYEPVRNVVLEFTNSEIRDFIAYDKKVIDVTAKIAVEVDSNQPIGVYFVN